MPTTPPSRQPTWGLERTFGFSDGVFAIAITLLVLSFQVPHVSGPHVDRRLFDALTDQGAVLFSFALSFFVIARFWFAHHRLSALLRRVNPVFVVWNLVLLASIVFIPFPTEVLGRYGGTTTAVVFYASALTITGASQLTVWWYAVTRHLIDDQMMSAQAQRQALLRAATLPVVFATSIPIAFINASIAPYWWILLAGQRWISGRFGGSDEPSEGDSDAG